MTSHSTPSDPIAYSYIRFSSPQQAEGDSLRRQTTKTAEWCKRHGVTLDTSITLRDLGVSAFKGRHRDDKKALGQFLKLVERGRVPKGSYLVIENLDRLSREDERTALRLWMDILDAGINIVQLTPETIFRHEKSDMMDVMRAIIELSRGHSESQVKSDRLLAAWGQRKKKGREEGMTITNRLPAWVEQIGERRVNIPERAAVIHRIFELSAQGWGISRIVRLLTEQGVPCFGRKGVWTRAYVALLLKDRRVVGECQPKLKDGKPDGEVIKDYYQPVVTESEWLAAQHSKIRRATAKQRRIEVDADKVLELHKQGTNVADIARELSINRPRIYRILAEYGKHNIQAKGSCYVHLFSGMLFNARDCLPYYPAIRVSKGSNYRVLVASSAADKGAEHSYSFPYDLFERIILDHLEEIDPKDILAGANGHDELVKLEAEIGGIEAEIAEASAFMDSHGFSATIGKRINALEVQHKEVGQRLSDARQRAANPLSASWGEMKSLLQVLDALPDKEEGRIRLRTALRRTVDSIWMVVVPRGKVRLAEAQIWFKGNHEATQTFRTYQIIYRANIANKNAKVPARYYTNTIKHPEAALQGMPFNMEDLRDPQDAENVQRFLERYPQQMIDRLLAQGQGIE